MAAAVGSSPRVLLYLFGSKDDLVRALLARARQDELVLLNNLSTTTRGATLRVATEQLWEWLVAPEHRSLLRLWFEGYARSLVDGTGPWAGFARQTVDDWLELLSRFQPTPWRNTDSAAADPTLDPQLFRSPARKAEMGRSLAGRPGLAAFGRAG